MQQQSSARLGALLALGAVIAWSLNFVIARGVADAMPPAALAFWRWLVASVVLIPLAWRYCWQQRRQLLPHWRFITISGLLGVTLYNLMMYYAAHFTEAFNLSLLAISAPVFMLILSLFVEREPVSWLRLAGIGITIAGVLALLTGGDWQRLASMQFGVGELWALLASLLFAIYSMMLKRKPAVLTPLPFLFLFCASGTVLLLPFYGVELALGYHTDWSLSVVGGVLYIGIGASVVGFYLWNRAVTYIGAANAGLIYFTLPLFSGIVATLTLGEPITLLHGICGLLIISGIVIANRAEARQKARQVDKAQCQI